MLRLLNKIPSHYSRAAVAAVLLWLSALVGIGLAGICLLAKWKFGYGIVFVLVGACVLGFMGCVLWLFIERLTGRVTPWRE